ncbi:MAG TPA: aspartate/glutamate racemase family protein [Hyphomicrobiales bacterium]|nr:aspartate/glutamate racemase family protein [Hyphomicrobiales bacterium]
MDEDRSRPLYGWRAKLGLVVPPTNVVNEAEWSRVMPDGVSFHTARMALHGPADGPQSFAALAARLATKVEELASAGVDVVAYACTADSMVVPPRRLPDAVANGTPVVTTAEAIVAAMASFGATRISVATPFPDALGAREIEFFAAVGIEVVNLRGLGIPADDHWRVPRVPIETVHAHARGAFAAGSDALLITCTDFPCMPLIEPLEHELGVPVVTSNQATLWHALRTAGVEARLPGLGRLLAAA